MKLFRYHHKHTGRFYSFSFRLESSWAIQAFAWVKIGSAVSGQVVAGTAKETGERTQHPVRRETGPEVLQLDGDRSAPCIQGRLPVQQQEASM